MKNYRNLIMLLPFMALSSCYTDSKTGRSYYGISGPPKALNIDELNDILSIPGVISVKDSKLAFKDSYRIVFTPKTNECHKTWLGQRVCQTDKRPIEQTDSYKAIIQELNKKCENFSESRVVSDSFFSAVPYRLIVACAQTKKP